ncbi:MAG: EamA family transporter [bacterium]|nr:EamA family transporter [bacterium]
MDQNLAIALAMIAGAFALAFLGVFERWGLKDRNTPMQFLVWGFTLSALILLAIYVVRWGVSWPEHLLPGFWIAIVGWVAANYFINYLNAKAATYKQGEIGFTKPLQAMTPGLITVLAVLVGEMPGPVGLIGIGCMALGSWFILLPKDVKYWWEYLGPLNRLALIARYATLSPTEKEGVIVGYLALGSAALGTFGLLFDGLYTRRGGDLQGLWLGMVVALGTLSGIYALRYRLSAEYRQSVWPKGRYLLAIVGFGAMIALAHWFIQPVFTETLVAYVGTLKRLSILASVLLGYVLFSETDFRKRIGAAALITAGAILIGSDDLPERLSAKIELFGF